MLAVLLTQMGEIDAAEPHFVALLADPVRRWDIPYYLGGLYERRELWDRALEWFDQVEWGDNLVNARVKAAHMLFKLGRVDEATSRLAHLHREFPAERPRLFRAEAELHSRIGDPSRALDVYDRAVGELPEDTAIRYSRALQRERMGMYDLAIADLRVVHRMQPESAEAQNALGYVLADRGPPSAWPEARALIASALAQEPDNAAFIDSMGWVLFRLGRLDEAHDWLARAWSLYRDAEIGAHLGEVLWVLDRRDDALRIWQQAAAIEADHPVLVETLERLMRKHE
jgi:tetratricopeptide (TPR) repeat protein